MKLSIVMPVYNAEKYLKAAVESVIAQTFQDWELILVDDGSTDSSGGIADIFAVQDSRIKVIHQKNTGAPYARMRGIMIALGEYIGFMDSDDLLHPQMYEIMFSIQAKYNAGIVCCAHTIGSEYDDIITNKYTPHIYTVDSENVERWEIEDCYRKIFSAGGVYMPVVTLWNKIYPSKLAKKYFPKNNAEDIVYNIRAMPRN